MKFLKWTGIVILLLIVAYFLGPRPSAPQLSAGLPAVPAEPLELERYLRAGEAKHKLKPDNEARIIWAGAMEQTDYAFVYLHGFSASQEEGDPVHTELARRFGANLYLSRLAEHGIDTTEPLVALTADGLWESAKEAYAIGRRLGRKVILMGTSTGGTLALKLAAEYPEIAGVILLSPNIEINDPNAWVLNNPWGLQVAHLVKGEYKISEDTAALYRQYWNQRYRMEAAVQLQELLEQTMKASLFERVKQPVLLLYYYKDEEHQDEVVRVSAMRRMFRQLGTDSTRKFEQALPLAGNHVIGSYIRSQDVKGVQLACEQFVSRLMPAVPLDSSSIGHLPVH